MDEAQNVLTANGVEAVWDGSVSQNYATFEKDNSTYQILAGRCTVDCRESKTDSEI